MQGERIDKMVTKTKAQMEGFTVNGGYNAMSSTNAKNEMMILQGPLKKVNSIIYDNINENLIKRCAINTKGSSGPSGVDADFWRKIISSDIYGTTSDDLCHAIALMTRKLCSDKLQNSNSIQALMACRLKANIHGTIFVVRLIMLT